MKLYGVSIRGNVHKMGQCCCLIKGPKDIKVLMDKMDNLLNINTNFGFVIIPQVCTVINEIN